MTLWYTAVVPANEVATHYAGSFLECGGKKFSYRRDKEKVIIYLAPKNSKSIEFLWCLVREQYTVLQFDIEEKQILEEPLNEKLRRRAGFLFRD